MSLHPDDAIPATVPTAAAVDTIPPPGPMASPGTPAPRRALWRRLLAPPVFPGDEVKTRNAAFLNVILLTGIFSQAFAPVMWSGTLLRQIVMTVSMLGICGINLTVVRKGYVYAASLIHCVLFWVMCAMAVATSGGIRAPGFTGFVLAVGCAGLLLGWRWMVGLTAATILFGAGLTWAEQNGMVDYTMRHDTIAEAWLTQTVILTFIAIFLGLAMRFLQQSQARARTELEERLRKEATLRQVEQKYHEIFNATNEAILIHDLASGAILEANRTALERFGYQPDLLKTLQLSDLRAEKTLAARGEALARFDLARQAGPQVFEWLCAGRQAEPFWAEVSLRRADIAGRPCVLTVMRDISERRKIEEQVRQLQREESIGRLAGGVAHDFNNILMAIQGMAELLRLKLPESAVAREHLDKIESATQRGAALTRQLLAFARKQVIQPAAVDLNEMINQVADILRPLLPANIDLLLQLPAPLRPALIDANQFEQVLINLAVNARDAMPTGGTLTIRTENAVLSSEFLRLHPELLPGDAIRVTVRDTGTGMAPDVQARLFEPFFTTKPVGKGTGLGLAMCSGIVKQNRGHIEIDSAPGAGTTVSIYLPAAPMKSSTSSAVNPAIPEAAVAGTDPALTPAPAAIMRSERILFVEDDPAIRDSVAPLLVAAGYEVVTAENGQEALDLAERTSHPFDLLVTDMVMPRMGGAELAAALRKNMPKLRVVYTSGYTDPGATGAQVLQDSAFLAKPYLSGALLSKLRLVLDREDTPLPPTNPPASGKASFRHSAPTRQ